VSGVETPRRCTIERLDARRRRLRSAVPSRQQVQDARADPVSLKISSELVRFGRRNCSGARCHSNASTLRQCVARWCPALSRNVRVRPCLGGVATHTSRGMLTLHLRVVGRHRVRWTARYGTTERELDERESRKYCRQPTTHWHASSMRLAASCMCQAVDDVVSEKP
jgi:hypothetical protein